jgi:phosphate transport system ATP-binding protein
MTIDPFPRDETSRPDGMSRRGAGVPLGHFPLAWVVQVVDGDPVSAEALIAEVLPCDVTVLDDRILARDGDGVEWSWFAADIETLVHGTDATWTIFDVPGINDFGISVPVDRADEFRRMLDTLPGVTVRFQESRPAPTAQREVNDIGDMPWANTAPASGPLPIVIGSPAPTSLPAPPPPPPPSQLDPLITTPLPVVVGAPAPTSLPGHHGDEPSAVLVSSAVVTSVHEPAPSRRALFGRRNVATTVEEVVSWPGTLAGIDARSISAWFGSHKVLDRVSLQMQAGKVTALIGPSGCGKSTFLRILNRMHEMIPGAQMDGQVIVDGHDIYDPERKLTDARREVGMVFQKPNPFPAMSIYDNVLASLRLTGVKATTQVKDEIVESCLMKAGLWNEVKDRLRQPGGGLSGGQQQRLCIARALSIRPRVLLMDEPCSALDPTSTRRIEETIMQLVSEVTIVIVTHNMQQAARVSNHCAFFLAEHGTPGVIVEHGPTDAMFGSPQDPRTSDYVMGRFG